MLGVNLIYTHSAVFHTFLQPHSRGNKWPITL